MRTLAYGIGLFLIVGGMMNTGGGLSFILGIVICFITAATTPNEVD